MAIKGKRTEIACIVCDKAIKFPEYIGENYKEGHLRCSKCGSLLHIKLNKWEVEQYKMVERGEGQPSETLRLLRKMARKDRAQPAKSNEPRDQST